METDGTDGTERDNSQRYVDGGYLANNPQWHDDDAPWKADQIRRLLADERVAPSSICDVGCGTAGVLAALRPSYPAARLLGVEASPQATELARRAHPEIPVVASLGAVDDHFDLLMAIDVFEHAEDYFAFLRSLHGHADRYLFHIPLDLSLSTVARAGKIVERRQGLGHVHMFSREMAIAAVEESGYRVLAERYTPVAISAPLPGIRPALLRLPRRLGAAVAPHLTARVLGGFSMLVLAELAA